MIRVPDRASGSCFLAEIGGTDGHQTRLWIVNGIRIPHRAFGSFSYLFCESIFVQLLVWGSCSIAGLQRIDYNGYSNSNGNSHIEMDKMVEAQELSCSKMGRDGMVL